MGPKLLISSLILTFYSNNVGSCGATERNFLGCYTACYYCQYNDVTLHLTIVRVMNPGSMTVSVGLWCRLTLSVLSDYWDKKDFFYILPLLRSKKDNKNTVKIFYSHFPHRGTLRS